MKQAEINKLLTEAVRLNSEGKTSEAEKLCEKVLVRDRSHFGAMFTLGLIRFQQGRHDESAEIFLKASRQKPHEREPRLMLFSSYNDGGNIEGILKLAQEFRDHPLSVEETFLAYWGFLRACDWENASALQQKMLELAQSDSVRNDLISGILLGLNSIPRLPAELVYDIHRRWGKAIEGNCPPYSHHSPEFTDTKLKIAYLSADFSKHPVGFFSEALVNSHDRAHFEVYCYARIRHDDEMTERFRHAADHFVDITHLSHAEAAARIKQDNIHILIELGGHTSGSPLQILAYKPAPVQISYLGYPNTSGLSTIDYRISDPYTDMEGGTEYVEELLRMPKSFLGLRAFTDIPRVETAPSEETGQITFGSFNHIRKLNRDVIATWSRILNRVEGSRLLIKARDCENEVLRDNIKREFANHGIASEQLEFAAFTESYEMHARKYNEVDIALDTFPYTGTTTTCEALWMGVPVVTLCGNSHASRVSYSILKNIGFEVSIAGNEDEYVEKAVALARNPEYLGLLRKCLPTLFQQSIICQPEQITRSLERLYIEAWNRKMEPTFILPEEQGGLVEKIHSAYEWIFVTGMPRSGSTWCYNIARSLLEHANQGTPVGFVGEKEAVDKVLQTPSPDSSPRLIKFHSTTKTSLNMLASGKAKAIYSQRDLRDVAVSLMDFENSSFDQLVNGRLQGIMTEDARWKQADSTCHIEYADIMQQPEQVIQKIAAFLDIEADEETAARIAAACSIEATRKHIAAIQQGEAAHIHTRKIGNGRQYDTATLLHGNHIASGETGRYRHALNSGQIRRLNSLLGEWLVKHGYETAAVETHDMHHKPNNHSLIASIRNDIRICLPDSIQLMTPYVLLEQQDWFEDEIRFVRKLMKPGMHVIDIGANYGCYALTMAKLIGKEGRLWAFEPSSATADFLEQSIALNKLHNIRLMRMALSDHEGEAELSLCENSELNALVQSQDHHADTPTETVPLRRLDDCMETLAWPNIDFIKLDAEGEEIRILEGGQTFFTDTSPLIMFELKHGDQVNEGLIQSFMDLGYQTYRLIPGLLILAPFDLQAPVDAYQLNLFCCKEDRAEELEKLGLLTRHPSDQTVKEPPSQWHQWLQKFPFTKNLLPLWKERIDKGELLAGWSVYENALDSFALSQQDVSASVRYAYLEHAFLQLVLLLDEFVNLPRLMSLARITAELGQRAVSVQVLNQIVEHLQHDPNFIPSEPFLVVSKEWENIDPGHHLGDWCLAQILVQKEKLQAFSSYFTDTSSLPVLNTIEALGYLDGEMMRRKQLIRQRFGLESKAAAI